MPPLTPALQARVQACGSAILQSRMMNGGAPTKIDFTTMQFMDMRNAGDEFQCMNCGTTDKKMLSCGTCHGVSYCSVPCQREDWKSQHKYRCLAMKEAYEGMKLGEESSS